MSKQNVSPNPWRHYYDIKIKQNQCQSVETLQYEKRQNRMISLRSVTSESQCSFMSDNWLVTNMGNSSVYVF